jgi:hypothetical protein
VARIDKYDPISGGFRAPLAADLPATSKTGDGNPIGVGLDANGRVVPGAGNSGIMGALVTTKDLKAGAIVDVMTDGEIVEFVGVAGTAYSVADADGTFAAIAAGGVPGAGLRKIGATVEATRLVVRVQS